MLTLSFLFYCPRFQVQHSASIFRLSTAQLFLYFFCVVRMNLRIEAGAVPIILRVIQNWCHRIGYVDDRSAVAADYKQKAIRCFEDQVFQLLIGEKGGFVRAI